MPRNLLAQAWNIDLRPAPAHTLRDNRVLVEVVDDSDPSLVQYAFYENAFKGCSNTGEDLMKLESLEGKMVERPLEGVPGGLLKVKQVRRSAIAATVDYFATRLWFRTGVGVPVPIIDFLTADIAARVAAGKKAPDMGNRLASRVKESVANMVAGGVRSVIGSMSDETSSLINADIRTLHEGAAEAREDINELQGDMVEVFERLGEVEKQQREQAAGESSAAAAAAAAAEAASAAAGHAAAAAGDAAASQTASQSAADDSARLHGSAEATHAFTASAARDAAAAANAARSAQGAAAASATSAADAAAGRERATERAESAAADSERSAAAAATAAAAAATARKATADTANRQKAIASDVADLRRATTAATTTANAADATASDARATARAALAAAAAVPPDLGPRVLDLERQGQRHEETFGFAMPMLDNLVVNASMGSARMDKLETESATQGAAVGGTTCRTPLEHASAPPPLLALAVLGPPSQLLPLTPPRRLPPLPARPSGSPLCLA